jgi:hypothetical protein
VLWVQIMIDEAMQARLKHVANQAKWDVVHAIDNRQAYRHDAMASGTYDQLHKFWRDQGQWGKRVVQVVDREALLTAALERISSGEAFAMARMLDPDRDIELILRMRFAREILSNVEAPVEAP